MLVSLAISRRYFRSHVILVGFGIVVLVGGLLQQYASMGLATGAFGGRAIFLLLGCGCLALEVFA